MTVRGSSNPKAYFDYWSGLFNKVTDPDFIMSIMLAQVAHESAWSTSELAREANNHAGHKAGDEWSGEIYIKDAGEHVNGQEIIQRNAHWRHYETDLDFAKHHAKWLTRTETHRKIYAKALIAKTPQEQAKALTGVYATDPEYDKKLLNYITKYNLTQYDTENKKETDKMAYIGLDIGHGSNTFDTGGGKGLWKNGVKYEEHDFNSDVAIEVKKHLESAGHKVTYGVQAPHSPEVGLTARTNWFNANKVDLVVSIHADWNDNPNANGRYGFYWHNHTESKKLAEAIKKAIEKAGFTTRSLQASLIGSWTNLHMVRETAMTSNLWELGFMSGNLDFDLVFGSKTKQYRKDIGLALANGILGYLGDAPISSNSGATYNPQGLQVVEIPEYTDNGLGYKELKAGDSVTLMDPFYWYDPKNHVWMISKKHDELAGTTDKIKEVFTIKGNGGGSSKRYYLLDKYNSFIFEQYLKEARAHWEPIDEVKPDDVIEDGENTIPETEVGDHVAGNYAVVDGVRYKLIKE